jgi:hypothetical protein
MVIRVVVGLGPLALWSVLDTHSRHLALVGFVPFSAAGIGYGPLSSIIGIRTGPNKRTPTGVVGKQPA